MKDRPTITQRYNGIFYSSLFRRLYLFGPYQLDVFESLNQKLRTLNVSIPDSPIMERVLPVTVWCLVTRAGTFVVEPSCSESAAGSTWSTTGGRGRVCGIVPRISPWVTGLVGLFVQNVFGLNHLGICSKILVPLQVWLSRRAWDSDWTEHN